MPQSYRMADRPGGVNCKALIFTNAKHIVTEYARNSTLHQDLRVATVDEVVRHNADRHVRQLLCHLNFLELDLLDNSMTIHCLHRTHPSILRRNSP